MNLQLDKLFENCAYNIKYEQIGKNVNYAFVEDGETLYIYFQGSSSIFDWVRNFLFFKRPYKRMNITFFVHSGFLSAWKEVENIISNKILEKVPLQDGHYDYKFKKIISVGYSHGGALSGLCHEFVWFNRPDIRNNIFGVGFESPRFYRGLFVNKKLKERWENYIVIRNHFDIVTFLPPRLFLFTHVGTVCTLNQTSTVNYKRPKCIGAHYPSAVLESLKEYYKK